MGACLGRIQNCGPGAFEKPHDRFDCVGVDVVLLGPRAVRPGERIPVLAGGGCHARCAVCIGASLASKSAERIEVAAWLSFCKLVLHPLSVALAALVLFPVEPFAAVVMISASALPVAGNVYMLAQYYNVAPARVSAAILVTTAVSIVTVSLVIGWLSPLS